MSNSQHPVALRLEEEVGGATRLLITVMGLPLVDGIFAALVLAGMLETVGGILQIGLLVFGGSATVAVILAEMEGSPNDHIPAIAIVGGGLILLAALQAALAPTIESILNLPVFKRFAALVILAIAAKTASARVGEYLPRPAVIIGLGLLASLDPAGATLTVTYDPNLILRGAAAAGVGVGFALLVALLGPILRGVVDLDRFRFGSAVALGTLPLGLLDLVPGNAPLAVLLVSGVLAFDPTGPGSPLGKSTTAPDGGTNTSSDPTPDPSLDDADERPPWL